jgi:hypothetical protein
MLGWIFLSFEQYLREHVGGSSVPTSHGHDGKNILQGVKCGNSSDVYLLPTLLPSFGTAEINSTTDVKNENGSYSHWDEILNEFRRLRGIGRGDPETNWILNDKYSDEEFYDLVSAAVVVTNISYVKLIEGLGSYILTSSR